MNDFLIDEIVVCIYNKYVEDELTIGYEYEIVDIITDYDEIEEFVVVRNNLTECESYSYSNFISLKEYNLIHRKDKINKLLK